jgi:iron complex outermembrane receptor protein
MPRLTPVAMACTMAVAFPSLALAQAAEPPSKETQTITVTASKRVERLQDTPTAITALSGEKLEQLGVEKFADYVSLIPNLAQANGGGAGAGTVVMRGLYTGSQQTTATTAFYLGESPFTASASLAISSISTPDPDLVNVQRVEVLKGPQGTLFGASSVGGLIRIIPALPDTSAFSGSIRLGLSKVSGGGEGGGARVSLNVPVTKDFGLLVSAFSRKDGGFTTNVKTGAKNQGETDASGGQVTALFKVDRGWDVTARVLSQEMTTRGAPRQDNVQARGTPVTGERQFSAFDEPSTKVRYELAELSTDYQASIGTLTATVSRAKSRVALHEDYTGPYGIVVASSLPAGFGLLGDIAPSFTKTTAEVRFAAKRMGNFEALAGLFYTQEDNTYDTRVSTVLANGTPAPAPFGNFLSGLTLADYREQAVFANATYYITNDFDIGAGLRHSKNEQIATISRAGLLAGAASGRVNVYESEESTTTYQLTARWRLDRDLSTYVRYATGYRPGGPQTNANPPPGTPLTFESDTVANVELGVKGVALDRKLSFDASVYQIDWKDVQLNGLSGGTLLVGNAGKAVVKGIEVQLTYNPTTAISVGAGLGYNDAKLTEVGTAQAANLGAVVGDRLPGSPRLSGAVYGDWRFPVAGMTGSVGATVRHQGDKPSSFSAPAALNRNYMMPAYTTVDLRASLEWNRYSLRLRLDNATDKNGYAGYGTNRISPAQTTLPSNVSLIRPRTVSLTFGADF